LSLLLLVGATGCGSGKEAVHPAVAGARPVLTTPASEEGPAAGAGWLAWMQSAGVNPDPPRSATVVYVRRGSRRIRVNPPGTYAETGGFQGGRLVLQIIRGGRSRLAFYNLSTGTLSDLPRYVNDGAWLWRPDLDRSRILYGAIVPGTKTALSYEIRLADLAHHRVKVLERLDAHAVYSAPGQLSGDWATWLSCPDNNCRVRRERLSSGRVDGPPYDLSHPQVGPAVDLRGEVYYGRAKGFCGDFQIRRWNGRRDTRVLHLPKGYGFQYAYLTRSTHLLYFDLTGCSRSARSDIYELRVE
jgi:hypothetical protein